MNILCKNIQWDTSGNDGDGVAPELPESVLVTNVPVPGRTCRTHTIADADADADKISDLLTEQYGFCHKGFEMESVPFPVLAFSQNVVVKLR